MADTTGPQVNPNPLDLYTLQSATTYSGTCPDASLGAVPWPLPRSSSAVPIQPAFNIPSLPDPVVETHALSDVQPGDLLVVIPLNCWFALHNSDTFNNFPLTEWGWNHTGDMNSISPEEFKDRDLLVATAQTWLMMWYNYYYYYGYSYYYWWYNYNNYYNYYYNYYWYNYYYYGSNYQWYWYDYTYYDNTYYYYNYYNYYYWNSIYSYSWQYQWDVPYGGLPEQWKEAWYQSKWWDLYWYNSSWYFANQYWNSGWYWGSWVYDSWVYYQSLVYPQYSHLMMNYGSPYYYYYGSYWAWLAPKNWGYQRPNMESATSRIWIGVAREPVANISMIIPYAYSLNSTMPSQTVDGTQDGSYADYVAPDGSLVVHRSSNVTTVIGEVTTNISYYSQSSGDDGVYVSIEYYSTQKADGSKTGKKTKSVTENSHPEILTTTIIDFTQDVTGHIATTTTVQVYVSGVTVSTTVTTGTSTAANDHMLDDMVVPDADFPELQTTSSHSTSHAVYDATRVNECSGSWACVVLHYRANHPEFWTTPADNCVSPLAAVCGSRYFRDIQISSVTSEPYESQFPGYFPIWGVLRVRKLSELKNLWGRVALVFAVAHKSRGSVRSTSDWSSQTWTWNQWEGTTPSSSAHHIYFTQPYEEPVISFDGMVRAVSAGYTDRRRHSWITHADGRVDTRTINVFGNEERSAYGGEHQWNHENSWNLDYALEIWDHPNCAGNDFHDHIYSCSIPNPDAVIDQNIGSVIPPHADQPSDIDPAELDPVCYYALVLPEPTLGLARDRNNSLCLSHNTGCSLFHREQTDQGLYRPFPSSPIYTVRTYDHAEANYETYIFYVPRGNLSPKLFPGYKTVEAFKPRIDNIWGIDEQYGKGDWDVDSIDDPNLPLFLHHIPAGYWFNSPKYVPRSHGSMVDFSGNSIYFGKRTTSSYDGTYYFGECGVRVYPLPIKRDPVDVGLQDIQRPSVNPDTGVTPPWPKRRCVYCCRFMANTQDCPTTGSPTDDQVWPGRCTHVKGAVRSDQVCSIWTDNPIVGRVPSITSNFCTLLRKGNVIDFFYSTGYGEWHVGRWDHFLLRDARYGIQPDTSMSFPYTRQMVVQQDEWQDDVDWRRRNANLSGLNVYGVDGALMPVSEDPVWMDIPGRFLTLQVAEYSNHIVVLGYVIPAYAADDAEAALVGTGAWKVQMARINPDGTYTWADRGPNAWVGSRDGNGNFVIEKGLMSKACLYVDPRSGIYYFAYMRKDMKIGVKKCYALGFYGEGDWVELETPAP